MKNLNPVKSWLYLGVFLIVLMVVVGGAVRLTDSGLSIVKWNPITGIVPPLNDVDWEKEFSDYKNIPEFQIENKNFSLQDFKKIYLWEYFHRLIARLIGLVFLIPFLFFWIRGYFKHENLFIKIFLIFLLASFQAWLGWYMVQSGFSDRTDVSHYRLAIHLLYATLLASYVLWLAMDMSYKEKKANRDISLRNWTIVGLGIIAMQLLYGAFTAGLNAGYHFPQYPKMGGEWIPKLALAAFNQQGMISLIRDPGLVHFIHRWFAIFVLLFVMIYYFRFKNISGNTAVRRLLNLSLFIIVFQVILGIITVLTRINIVIALLHQVNGILLFLCMVALLFFSLGGNRRRLASKI